MAKAKVRLSYTVELFIEGESEDDIQNWLLYTTPTEAKQLAKENGNWIFEDHDEEIICMVDDESVVDVVIK